MSTTITDGTTTITPDLVLGWDPSSQSGNIIHTIPGSTSPGVTLGDDVLPAGTLQLFFRSTTAANTAIGMLNKGRKFTLASTDLAGIGGMFVRQGAMTPTYDVDSQTWTIAVGYQGVSS